MRLPLAVLLLAAPAFAQEQGDPAVVEMILNDVVMPMNHAIIEDVAKPTAAWLASQAAARLETNLELHKALLKQRAAPEKAALDPVLIETSYRVRFRMTAKKNLCVYFNDDAQKPCKAGTVKRYPSEAQLKAHAAAAGKRILDGFPKEPPNDGTLPAYSAATQNAPPGPYHGLIEGAFAAEIAALLPKLKANPNFIQVHVPDPKGAERELLRRMVQRGGMTSPDKVWR